MSQERIKGEHVFVCDDCDDVLEPGTGDFTIANMAREEADWRAYPDDDGVWRHRCPDCQW
jgi:hypothetical protein